MVADAEVNGQVAEGHKLVLNKIGPGVLEILADGSRPDGCGDSLRRSSTERGNRPDASRIQPHHCALSRR